MRAPSRRRVAVHFIVAAIGALVVAASAAHAAEVTVQNDSLSAGDDGIIQAGFVAGESAASWLTSPCDGTIVAVQVFWRSLFGTTGQTLQDSVTIFNGGAFPTPGAVLTLIEGPVMTDSVINEFRFLDENNTIPLSVPVTNGQTFVVSFRFFETPNPVLGPSVVIDIDGCQAGKNTIDASGLGWISSCLLGVTGDWVIRAVVECPGGPVGPGSVPNGGDAPGVPLLIDLVSGQLELNWSDSCSSSDNDYEVYEGFMGAYYSHFSKFCSTGGKTAVTFPPDIFNRYYLVVPTDGVQEGSYGRDSDGNERPQGGGPCETQGQILCPAGP